MKAICASVRVAKWIPLHGAEAAGIIAAMPRLSERIVAFAPLTVLTVAAVIGAGAGLRTADSADDPATEPGTPVATSSPTSMPTPTPAEDAQPAVTLKQARQQWDDAMVDSVLEGSGRYEWSVHVVGLDVPMIEESGVFGFAPMRTSFSRTMTNPDPDPGDPSSYLVTMVRRDHKTFMQMGDWGPWDGCWLELTAASVAEEMSPEQRQMLAQVQDAPEIPPAISVPLNSTVSRTSGTDLFPPPYVEYTARVSLYEALGFVGVSGRTMFPYRDALLNAKAPIVVAIGVDERPLGARASGADVARAMRRSKVDMGPRTQDMIKYLRYVSSEMSFTDLGTGADVDVPDAAHLLPDGATRTQTCAANR